MKSGKQHMTKGTILPNQEKNQKTRTEDTNKYLEILEADTIKQVEMKKI